MLRNKYFQILLVIVILVLLIKLLTIVFVEPWIGEKIEAKLNEKGRNFQVEIDKVHIMMFSSGIELKNITISSKQENSGNEELNGRIESLKFKGINLAKALFKKDIDISKVVIFNSSIKGKIPFSGKTSQPIIAPSNIRIGSLLFDKTDLAIESTSTAQSVLVKKSVLKVYDLQVEKKDTLSPGIVKQFDFEAEEIVSVSADSMYSFTVGDIIYSATSNTLAIDSFSIQPNYKNYDFTSRYKFQTGRFEAGFSNIYVHDFYATDYFRTRSLISSYVEIGKMDMKVFRDKRKEFRHVIKPAFQDMIYNYPGIIRIDSIGLINGDVTFTAHAEQANEPGSISFNKIHAKIYKITNDTIYKKESAFLELKGDALLIGKSKMSVLLKGRIFDRQNSFSLNGSLSGLEANELNPVLEKNAFIYATSGKIDEINFSFTANNDKATGKMTMLYHGLHIAVKNKRTDDTTAFRERFISFIANKKVLDSNPMPGKEVRVGIIDYERDHERFLFNYCFKSILSGIKSSLMKSPKKK
jgi:hypothetical protein